MVGILTGLDYAGYVNKGEGRSLVTNGIVVSGSDLNVSHGIIRYSFEGYTTKAGPGGIAYSIGW